MKESSSGPSVAPERARRASRAVYRCAACVVVVVLVLATLYVAERLLPEIIMDLTAHHHAPGGDEEFVCTGVRPVREWESELKDPIVRWWRRGAVGALWSSRTGSAILGLAAVRDRRAAERMRSRVLAADSWSAKCRVWGFFWIERDDATPFLIECVKLGGEYRREAALLCLQRLSFLMSPNTDDENELVHFWSAWWDENRATTWDERFVEQLEDADITVRRDANGAISLETLLDACERFPLKSGWDSDVFKKKLDVYTLVAMRVSEMLCERTGLQVTPWSFPYGYPDESWNGLRGNAGPPDYRPLPYEQGWRWRQAIRQLQRTPGEPSMAE